MAARSAGVQDLRRRSLAVSSHGRKRHARSTGLNAAALRADGGWREIDAKWRELNPGDFATFEVWNNAGAPEASHFFPQVSTQRGLPSPVDMTFPHEVVCWASRLYHGRAFLPTDLAKAVCDPIVRNFISGQCENALRVVSTPPRAGRPFSANLASRRRTCTARQ
jgi:hypothetical protein